MKTAIYIEGGITQIVLTPETALEREIVKTITGDKLTVDVKRGAFYPCNGGWVRHGDTGEESLMLVTRPNNCGPILS